MPGDRFAIASTCSGVVPQQPPTAFTKPLCCELAQQRRRLGRRTRRSRRTRSAARRSDSTRRARRPRGPARPARGASPSPPREQLIATASRPACSIEAQNASTVWPDNVRPLRSTTVSETTSGNSGATSRAATIAAFAFSVSKTVSISRRSTPPSARPRICSAYASRTSSKLAARKRRIVDARRHRERHVQRADRPGHEPRPRRACRASSHAARARRAPSRFNSYTALLEPVVRLADRASR